MCCTAAVSTRCGHSIDKHYTAAIETLDAFNAEPVQSDGDKSYQTSLHLCDTRSDGFLNVRPLCLLLFAMLTGSLVYNVISAGPARPPGGATVERTERQFDGKRCGQRDIRESGGHQRRQVQIAGRAGFRYANSMKFIHICGQHVSNCGTE